MKKIYQGFLYKKNNKIYVNHNKTDSIITNRYYVDLLLYYQNRIKGKLLDAGCGEKPYKLIYDDLVDESLGCDVETCKHNQKEVDVFASLDNLPFQNEEFDTILCTNVLEHVANMEKAFSEVSRVLKKEGRVIIILPFLYPVHEAPYDFYRYTKYGIKHQLEQNNLEIEEFVPCGSIGLLLIVYMNMFLCKVIKVKIIRNIACCMQEIFYGLYKLFYFEKSIIKGKKIGNIISIGNFIIARKN